MSGSGSAFYAIFHGERAAWRARGRVDAPFIGVYEPVSRGVEIL